MNTFLTMSVLLMRNLFLVILLLRISIFDFQYYIIPDKYIVAVLGNWMAFQICEMPSSTLEGLLSGVVTAGFVLVVAVVFERHRNRKSLGGGDVKLIFAVSLYLGMDRSLSMLFVACVFGFISYGIDSFFSYKKEVFGETSHRKNNKKGKIPFGPSIAASTLFFLFLP